MVLRERYAGAALITGASSGLGAAFARQIAAAGMDVVLVARRRKVLESLAEELSLKHGVHAVPLAQDLSHPDAAKTIRHALDEKKIEISLLVNCAGAGHFGRFHESSPETEQAIVDLNCRAYVAMTAAFLPDMVRRRSGGVIMVSSTCSANPVPCFATYGAAKAFVTSFGQALAADLRNTGVDCLTFCPGWIRSEFHARAGVRKTPEYVVWNDPDKTARAALSSLGRETLRVYGATRISPLAGWLDKARALHTSLSRQVGIVHRLANLFCLEEALDFFLFSV